ncbi:MAG TPA: hypothetical protein VD969_21335 [Symbiobacteriaceae bacterium]|nr:hypothetical protein [Symbiobacteriaceae bacterium]
MSVKVVKIQIPVSLLCDPELIPPAKLIWAALCAGPMRPALVEAQTGLCRKTVLKGLDHLVRAGWCSVSGRCFLAILRPGASAQTVSLPVDLLGQPNLGSQAKLLYGILQLTPKGRRAAGHTSYAELRRLTGVSLNTVKQAMRELAQHGWIRAEQEHQNTPIVVTLRNPQAARSRTAARRVGKRVRSGRYRGETLMREFLSLLVDRTDYKDDDKPAFLVNPQTGGQLELDRFYPPDVAFEFNGPQHYHETERFTKQEAEEQEFRDIIKLGICLRRGVTVVIVHREDLSLEGMRKKVGNLLPLRDLTGQERVIKLLEDRAYWHRLGGDGDDA